MEFRDIRLDEGLIIVEKTAFMTKHELHAHDALEISIVLKNKIKYHLLHKDYFGHPGDVFLYRPFEPHYTLIEEDDEPAEWIMVLFSPSLVASLPIGDKLLTPFYSPDLSPHIPSDSPYASLIREASLQAVKEQKEQKPGWEAKRYINVYDILLYIYRHYMENSTDSDIDQTTVSEMTAVIRYMIQHSHEKIDAETLFSRTRYRKTLFHQKFKEIAGISPNRFLNRLRLQQAIHKLNHTNLPITEIALDCGFSNISYFNRCFSDYLGISPRQFRNRR